MGIAYHTTHVACQVIGCPEVSIKLEYYVILTSLSRYKVLTTRAIPSYSITAGRRFESDCWLHSCGPASISFLKAVADSGFGYNILG